MAGSLYKRKRKVNGKLVTSSKWYGKFECKHLGKPVVKSLCTDKAASLQMLADLVKESEQRKVGIIDQFHYDRKKPLNEHIEDYFKWCRYKSQDSKHMYNKKYDIDRLVNDIKANSLDDLQPDAVESHLQNLKDQDLSNRKVNAVRSAINAFMNWCVKKKRIASNPLKSLDVLSEKADRRKVRRVYSNDELLQLFEAAEIRPIETIRYCNRGVNKGKFSREVTEKALQDAVALGKYRRQIYSLAVQTGLRRNEVKGLKWSDINFEEESIRIRIEVGKAAREDFIPMHPDIYAEMLAFKPDNAKPSDLVFYRGLPDCLAFNRDLKRAGLPKKDAEGRVLDFHGFRHTFGTNLAKAGVTPQYAKDLMRHSTIQTTMTFYTHLTIQDAGSELRKLPSLGTAKTSCTKARA